MSTTPQTHHVDAPGGRVYYEVRGSGPLLLVIGQPMTSGPFNPMAELLADDYTVVTYDPTGSARAASTTRRSTSPRRSRPTTWRRWSTRSVADQRTSSAVAPVRWPGWRSPLVTPASSAP